MWPAIIQFIVEWLKKKPREDLIDQVVALRDTMYDCHVAYKRFAAAKEGGSQQAIDAAYRDWRGAFGLFDTAISDIDVVLEIFGKEAHDRVTSYRMAESAPCAEDGNTVSAAMLDVLDELPSDPQATTAKADFPEALPALDQFISATFTPVEIAAARRRRAPPR